jgi:hypothetical protein
MRTHRFRNTSFARIRLYNIFEEFGLGDERTHNAGKYCSAGAKKRLLHYETAVSVLRETQWSVSSRCRFIFHDSNGTGPYSIRTSSTLRRADIMELAYPPELSSSKRTLTGKAVHTFNSSSSPVLWKARQHVVGWQFAPAIRCTCT